MYRKEENMERTQVIIDNNKRAITIRTATGTFTQSGVSKPIIDLLNNLEEENKKLKSIIKEARKMIFENYGVLDKYEIEMLDDILKGE